MILHKMDKGALWMCVVTVSALQLDCIAAFVTSYMVRSCNVAIGEAVAGRIETDYALQYTPLMNCWITFSVPSGKQLFLDFKRFDLEEPLNGVCVDSLKIHDGSSTSAPLLTAEKCGVVIGEFNYTASTTSVTFHFKSDNNANFRGFEVIYLAVTSAPCDDSQFYCANKQFCVDGSLKCDGIDQCGDNSDESGCTAAEQLSQENRVPVAIIVGCLLAVALIAALGALVAYKLYKYYYWKKWLSSNQLRKYPWEENDADLYRYPKTDKYQIYDIGKQGRLKPQVASYFSTQTLVYENKAFESTNKYLDEQ